MHVDVAKVLKDKSPVIAGLTPRLVVNYLRRIVHEKQINYMLDSYGHLSAIEFIRESLKYMNISYHTVGMEKLDPKGRYIFASNHPFGGVDGLMLADEVYKYFGDVRVVVNDILMNITPLSPLFIPVNKHGRQNPIYAKLYAEAFAADAPIITFPAGLCSRRFQGKVKDLPWKPNFIKRAILDKRDVVPVYFSGELSEFFYRFYSIRTWLGLRANIEMLYLVDEMFKQKGRDFRIVIGDPVPYVELGEGHHLMACSEDIRRRVYDLKKWGE